MPLTKKDLADWERSKDLDKFNQIIQYLTEKEYSRVRLSAVQALCRISAPESIPTLLGVANNNNDPLKKVVHDELLYWIKKDCTPFCLFVENQRGNGKERKNALLLLSEVTNERIFESYLSLLKRGEGIHLIQEIIRKLPNQDFFYQKIKDSSPETRFSAALSLRYCYQNPQWFAGLSGLLVDEDVQVHRIALEMIKFCVYEIKDNPVPGITLPQEVIESMIRDLSHADQSIRLSALCVFEAFGEKAYLQFILPLLNDGESEIRMEAATILSVISDSSCFSFLTKAFENECIPENKEVLLKAIATCPVRESYDYLERIILDPSHSSLFIPSIKVIGITHDSRMFALLKKLNESPIHEVENAIIHTLKGNESLEAVNILFSILFSRKERKEDLDYLFSVLASSHQSSVIYSLLRYVAMGQLQENISNIITTVSLLCEPLTFQEYINSIEKSEDNLFKLGIQIINERMNKVIQTHFSGRLSEV